MNKLGKSRLRCLAQIARGDRAQIGPTQAGDLSGIEFDTLAGDLVQNKLVVSVERRDHTRVFELTEAGRRVLLALRQGPFFASFLILPNDEAAVQRGEHTGKRGRVIGSGKRGNKFIEAEIEIGRQLYPMAPGVFSDSADRLTQTRLEFVRSERRFRHYARLQIRL